jgi:serine/threonine-protein kinase RsbW
MPSSTAVEVRLPSRMGYEKVAMNTAASVAKLMGFTPERVEDLKTAIAEACINAIEHGNHFKEDLAVDVMLFISPSALEVRVADNGLGAKKIVPPPDMDRKMHGDEPPRGLGMFLIRALVDEAEWVTASDDGASYVRLVVHLNGVPAEMEKSR